MPQFKARVIVMFRKSILDPQGAAIERAVKGVVAPSKGSVEGMSGKISFPDVSSVRVGKVVDLTVEGTDAKAVEEKVKILADRILANPVMEQYTVEVEEVSGDPSPELNAGNVSGDSSSVSSTGPVP
jgi:phosphoribosylformylglycinamidine synthase